MLQITIPQGQMYDEENNEFIYIPETTIQLEHSLISISKWESKYHKPFLKKDVERTTMEIIDYIKCMTITKNVDERIYMFMTEANVDAINQYILDPMTATVITNNDKSSKSRIVTSELIYYWMITLNIPVQFEKWHINRLLKLIEVCNAENNPKKMSKEEILRNNAEINARRKKEMGITG